MKSYFRFLEIITHEFGHFITCSLLGCPVMVWAGHRATKEERKREKPLVPEGHRIGQHIIWFPWDKGFDGGGTTFWRSRSKRRDNTISRAGAVAQMLFLYLPLMGFLPSLWEF